jgi:hypothetical protein
MSMEQQLSRLDHAPLKLYAMGCAFWEREAGADDE